jgi:hypothetical protein
MDYPFDATWRNSIVVFQWEVYWNDVEQRWAEVPNSKVMKPYSQLDWMDLTRPRADFAGQSLLQSMGLRYEIVHNPFKTK